MCNGPMLATELLLPFHFNSDSSLLPFFSQIKYTCSTVFWPSYIALHFGYAPKSHREIVILNDCQHSLSHCFHRPIRRNRIIAPYVQTNSMRIECMFTQSEEQELGEGKKIKIICTFSNIRFSAGERVGIASECS